MLLAISPRRSILVTPTAGASRASWPVVVVHPCTFGLLRVDAIGEGATLARSVVGVLVPRALAVEEPVEVLLVGGGPKLRSVGDCDCVLRTPLAVPAHL